MIGPGAIRTLIADGAERRALERVRPPLEYPEGSISLSHGEPGSAERRAELVSFIASPRSRRINGTEVFIDGGQSLSEG